LQTQLADGIKTPELFSEGFCLREFPLDPLWNEQTSREAWEELDASFKRSVAPGGAFFQFLSQYYVFASVEFIISIRDSKNEWEEDGIWHDDGSRVFAFSLSLTPDGGVSSGGHLEMRRKGEEQIIASIPTPLPGTAILFLTGMHGFEHRTRQVLEGRRVILAGWCSL
jgi:hypothetical protein